MHKQMAKDPLKCTINKSQVKRTPSDHSYLITSSPEHPKTTAAQQTDLNSNLIKMIEAFKDKRNNSFKEIQENTLKR